MIKKLTGAIHVNKRHIMILTASDEKKYDGKPLAASGYEIISGELLPNHYLSVDNQGAQITVGESKNIAYASVVDKDGNILDGLYEVEIEYGTLRVTSSVVISPMELHIAYDGRAHYYSDYYTDPYNSVWVSEGKEFLPEGFRIYADVEGARTDVGISYSTITSFKVLDKNGNDITEYCNVGKADAMFEIVPIRITITTGSAEKDYDGSALVNKTYWVSVGKLYTGHKLTLTVTGKQVVPGESENKINIDSVMIVDGNGRNVTSFYTIDYAYGTLKVNNP
jgi:hypothetical protein